MSIQKCLCFEGSHLEMFLIGQMGCEVIQRKRVNLWIIIMLERLYLKVKIFPGRAPTAKFCSNPRL